jgi:hypothetical protein
MRRHVLHASLALMALAMAACASPSPPAETGQSAGETDGDATDNSTAGSGALIGNIWF